MIRLLSAAVLSAMTALSFSTASANSIEQYIYYPALDLEIPMGQHCIAGDQLRTLTTVEVECIVTYNKSEEGEKHCFVHGPQRVFLSTIIEALDDSIEIEHLPRCENGLDQTTITILGELSGGGI